MMLTLKNYFKFSFFLTTLFGLSSLVSAEAPTFIDVPLDHSDYATLEYLNQRDIFKGYPDGTFGLKNSMNRAELMAVVIRMMGTKTEFLVDRNCFPDVKDEWFAPYVCYAKKLSWVQGYQDGLFHPEQDVTKPEAFKMVLRPLFFKEIAAQGAEESNKNIVTLLAYSEPYQNQWYTPYLALLSVKNLNVKMVEIYSKTLDSEVATRSQVATLIFRSILVKENQWKSYDDYLRDLFFLKSDKKNLLSQSYPCYKFSDEMPTFMVDYIKEEYGTDVLAKILSENEEAPYFILSKFCLLEQGNYLLIGPNRDKDKILTEHVIHFDSDGKLIKDESIPCTSGFFEMLGESPYIPRKFDPNTFELIDCTYAKDATHVYGMGSEFEGVDPNTFEVLHFPYSKDAHSVYWGPEKLEGPDPKTFQVLPQNILDIEFSVYGKDAHQVYFSGDPLPGADPATFEVLPALLPPTQWQKMEITNLFFQLYARNYAKDKNHVYVGKAPVAELDPATFEFLDFFYAKNATQIYYLGESYYGDFSNEESSYLVEGADLDTFKSLNSPYAKDAQHLYYQGKVIPGADVESTQLIENPPTPTTFWLKTKSALYVDGRKIEGIADPNSFEVMDEHYGKDKVNVYYLNRKYDQEGKEYYFPVVEGADVMTFEAIEGSDDYLEVYRDADHLYLRDKRLETEALDLETLKWVDEFTLKDAKNFTCQLSYESSAVTYCEQK